MSKNSQDGSSTDAAPLPGKKKKILKELRMDEVVLFALLVLSGIGIALTDFDPLKGFWYWVAMAPLFWGGCVCIEWPRVKRRGGSKLKMIWHEIIHWFAFLVAVHLVFLLNYTGRMNSADVGLVALLVLALTTFFAGIRSDWRIILVSVFLGIALLGAALIEEYIWLLLIPVGLIVIGAIVWWRYR